MGFLFSCDCTFRVEAYKCHGQPAWRCGSVMQEMENKRGVVMRRSESYSRISCSSLTTGAEREKRKKNLGYNSSAGKSVGEARWGKTLGFIQLCIREHSRGCMTRAIKPLSAQRRKIQYEQQLSFLKYLKKTKGKKELKTFKTVVSRLSASLN